MIEKWFYEFSDKLIAWRQERHLDTEYQREGLIANITEELTEYKRATNDYDRIDALCDIAVFLINTLDKNQQSHITTIYNQEIVRLRNLSYDFVDLIELGYLPLIKTISNEEAHRDCIKDWDWNSICFEITIFLILIEDMIEQYDNISFTFAMEETFKEINSRTGYYDVNQKKFIKDKGFYKNPLEIIPSPFTNTNNSDYIDVKEEDDYFFVTINNEPTIKYKKWYKAKYFKE